MKCGHSVNAQQLKLDGSWIPCCAICNCVEQAKVPDLTGRRSKCVYYGNKYNRQGDKCSSEEDSDLSLPFFEYKPKKSYDEYYCGCKGWD